MREKCKAVIRRARELAGRVPRDTLVLAVLLGASSGSFALGYAAGLEASPAGESVTVVPPAAAPAAAGAAGSAAGSAAVVEGRFVASKNGTRYYLPACSGATRISEKNKVWFASAAAAEARGYTPAANCPMLSP